MNSFSAEYLPIATFGNASFYRRDAVIKQATPFEQSFDCLQLIILQKIKVCFSLACR